MLSLSELFALEDDPGTNTMRNSICTQLQKCREAAREAALHHKTLAARMLHVRMWRTVMRVSSSLESRSPTVAWARCTRRRLRWLPIAKVVANRQNHATDEPLAGIGMAPLADKAGGCGAGNVDDLGFEPLFTQRPNSRMHLFALSFLLLFRAPALLMHFKACRRERCDKTLFGRRCRSDKRESGNSRTSSLQWVSSEAFLRFALH